MKTSFTWVWCISTVSGRLSYIVIKRGRWCGTRASLCLAATITICSATWYRFCALFPRATHVVHQMAVGSGVLAVRATGNRTIHLYTLQFGGQSFAYTAAVALPDRAAPIDFVLSLAVSGGVVAVGSRSYYTPPAPAALVHRTGAVFFFDARTGLQAAPPLLAPGLEEDFTLFGMNIGAIYLLFATVVDCSSAAMTTETLVVSSPVAPSFQYVYVYRRAGTSFTLLRTIAAPQGTAVFGSALWLRGDLLLIGSIAEPPLPPSPITSPRPIQNVEGVPVQVHVRDAAGTDAWGKVGELTPPSTITDKVCT